MAYQGGTDTAGLAPLESVRRLREGGPGSGPHPGHGKSGGKEKSSGGGKAKVFDVYHSFDHLGEDHPAMNNMASQMRHIGKMADGKETVAKNPILVTEEGKRIKMSGDVSKEKMLKAAIAATRKEGVSGHYLSDAVVEEIRPYKGGSEWHIGLGT